MLAWGESELDKLFLAEHGPIAALLDEFNGYTAASVELVKVMRQHDGHSVENVDS